MSDASKTAATPLLDYPAPRAHPFDPPPEYQRRTKEEPVSRVRMADGREMWLVTGYDEAKIVFGDRRFSADRRHANFPGSVQGRVAVSKLRPLMITLDGEEHAKARKAILGEYTSRNISGLRPYIQRIADRFVDAMLEHGGPVDLVQALALPVPSLVICEHLGIPYEDHAMFEQLSIKMLQRGTTDEERAGLVGELRSYLDRMVTDKERDPGDDFLGRQIRKYREQGGEPNHEDLVGLAFLVLLAGHDTTSNMISLGVIALLQHPELLAQIKADPSKTPGAVEELLRYFTILETITARVAVEDVQVGDVLVKAGEGVIIAGNAADRDEKVFADPNRLDIARDAHQHLAFGYGPHRCVGDHLARLELQIVYDTLFRKIPDLRLAVPFDEVPFKHDVNFYGLYELPVTW